MTRADPSAADFWSRRRAAVQAEARAEEAARRAEEEAEARAALEARSDAEILAELNLPDPDRLQPGDDVAGFMARAVPDRLRRRALRRLWRLNPVLANVDGLVDYGEDFTDAACVLENLQTAYQVGKGMLSHLEFLNDPPAEGDPAATGTADTADAIAGTDAPAGAAAHQPGRQPGRPAEAQAEAQAGTQAGTQVVAEPASESPPDTPPETTTETAIETAAAPPDAPSARAQPQPQEPPRRRMRFTFEG